MSEYSNKATQVFADMLSTMDFELHRDNAGYYLVDAQGANWGDIESDRFNYAAEIIDRLNIYLNDYYFDDLEEAARNESVFDDYFIPTTAADWCEIASIEDREIKLFVSYYRHEFDVMDLMENHTDEINLDEVVIKE